MEVLRWLSKPTRVGMASALAVGIALLFAGAHAFWLVAALMAGFLGYSAAHLRGFEKARLQHESILALAAEYSEGANSAAWIDRQLHPHLPLPPLAGWTLSAETAGYLIRTIRDRKPDLVVELGSGVSTLLAAYTLAENGSGCIVSFDGTTEYAARTTSLVSIHGLSRQVQVHHAPLQHVEVGDWQGLWYYSAAFSHLKDRSVDMLIIDGPPSSTSPLARYPALPLLSRCLKPGALVLLDDANRPDEREILNRWAGAGWTAEVLAIGKGLAVLKTRQ